VSVDLSRIFGGRENQRHTIIGPQIFLQQLKKHNGPTEKKLKQAANKTMTSIASLHILPEDFIPDDSHVIIGRGRKCVEHSGNRRLRAIVKSQLAEYQQADKTSKSDMIMMILEELRGDNELCFVKHDPANNRFSAVEDAAARICIAQAFRDQLHGEYKSSKHNKAKQRLEMKRASSENLHAFRPKLTVEKANATWGNLGEEVKPRTRQTNASWNSMSKEERTAASLSRFQAIMKSAHQTWSKNNQCA
jgi:hypothetical protein